MIIFDFQIDQNSLIEDLRTTPELSNIAILEETYFIFPTRLNINGIEMLELSIDQIVLHGKPPDIELEAKRQKTTTQWLSLPILHLAFIGNEYVKKACQGMEISYSLPGTGACLLFVPNQATIEVHSSLNEHVVLVECRELIKAFDDFKHKVTSFVSSYVPEMKTNHEWLELLSKDKSGKY